MLGLWRESLSDLRVASGIDYDEEIGVALKKVISLLCSRGSLQIKRIVVCSFVSNYIIFLQHRLSLMSIKLRSIEKNMNACGSRRSRKVLNQRSNHKMKLK